MNHIISLNGSWKIDYLSKEPYMAAEEPPQLIQYDKKCFLGR